MNVLSYCDGMSCGQIALGELGLKVDKYYATEIKKSAINVTKSNFPNTKYLGDLTEISDETLTSLGSIDLFISGTPCKDFSQANRKRLGLLGEKSSLFYNFLHALSVVKPKYFFFENVKMDEKDMNEITKLLGVSPVRVNAKLLTGVLRDRFYWTNIPFKGDFSDRKLNLQDFLSSGYTEREKSRCFLESDSRPLLTKVKMFHRHYRTGFTTVIFENKEHYENCMKHYTENFFGKPANEIVCTSNVYDGLRYMSVDERGSLHGIPKGYFKNVSENEAFGLIGDGWSIDVVREFFKGLL